MVTRRVAASVPVSRHVSSRQNSLENQPAFLSLLLLAGVKVREGRCEGRAGARVHGKERFHPQGQGQAARACHAGTVAQHYLCASPSACVRYDGANSLQAVREVQQCNSGNAPT